MVFKKLKASSEDETDPLLWMFPYSNLMLILVLLFVALFSFSRFNSVEYETALADLIKDGGEDAAKKEVLLARSMKKFIEDSNLSDKAQINISASAIKMKMSSPVLFDSGSAELKGESIVLFGGLLEHLKNMENTIIVEGHTDDVPIRSELYGSNWELSAARAFSVIGFFINRGLQPGRLVAHGFGEFRPLFPNDTEDGRAKNRRIEITILRGNPKK